MRSEIYWITVPTLGRLAIVPRPRGGDWLEEEAKQWHSAGIDIVVSLLTKEETNNLDLAEERAACEAAGILFLEFPIVDRSVPTSKKALLDLASELAGRLNEGRTIAIHCRQGLGRAPLVAICILMATGIDLETALQRVGAARGCPVPETGEQARWLSELAKDFLASVPK
jgi:protein-tyrosine phosphatase